MQFSTISTKLISSICQQISLDNFKLDDELCRTGRILMLVAGRRKGCWLNNNKKGGRNGVKKSEHEHLDKKGYCWKKGKGYNKKMKEWKINGSVVRLVQWDIEGICSFFEKNCFWNTSTFFWDNMKWPNLNLKIIYTLSFTKSCTLFPA